jgi:predicted Zn finger-like uncharacterized protein
MYTHCPHCDTEFEISQEYLDIANGKVRCGKCDEVFNALENLYDEEKIDDNSDQLNKLKEKLSQNLNKLDTSKEINSPTHSTSTLIDPSINAEINKPKISSIYQSSTPIINIKEKMERIAASLSAATAELKNARQSSNAFQANHKNTSTSTETKTPLTPYNKNESSVTERLDPITPIPSIMTQAAETLSESLTIDIEQESPEELDLVNFDADNNLNETPQPINDYSPPKVDEGDMDILNSLMDVEEETIHNSFDSDLFDEIDQLNQMDDIDKTLSDTSSLDDELSNEDDFNDFDTGEDLLAELEQIETDFLQTTPDPNNITPTVESSDDNETVLMNLNDSDLINKIHNKSAQNKQPTEEEIVPSFLTQNDSSISSPMTLFLWLAGTIILLLILSAQYLHVNSVAFSQDPNIRPLLKILCSTTHCPLPLIKTPRKIVTVSHDVHSNPKINNALTIQLTFKNKASYTQGYPTLEITFSNPLGKVVARRRFSPRDYLVEQNLYKQGLASNKSQTINLEIVDPDPSALLSFQFNYF